MTLQSLLTACANVTSAMVERKKKSVKKTAVPAVGAAGGKSDRTRRKILNAALDLFRRRGFDETTMRAVAEKAGVAQGAAYYYFRSKNDIVLAYYLRCEEEMRDALPGILAESKSFRKRMQAVVEFRFRQFEPHRKFVSVLFQNSVNPDSPLSPFHAATSEIREGVVRTFDQVVDGSDIRFNDELRPHAPHLLWLFQLALLLYWMFDESEGRKNSRRLLDLSLGILMQVLRLQRLPFARGLVKSAAKALAEFSPARR